MRRRFDPKLLREERSVRLRNDGAQRVDSGQIECAGERRAFVVDAGRDWLQRHGLREPADPENFVRPVGLVQEKDEKPIAVLQKGPSYVRRLEDSLIEPFRLARPDESQMFA